MCLRCLQEVFVLSASFYSPFLWLLYLVSSKNSWQNPTPSLCVLSEMMLTPSLASGMSLWDSGLAFQPSGCSDWLGWAHDLLQAKGTVEQEAWLSFLLGLKKEKHEPRKGSPLGTMMSLRMEKSWKASGAQGPRGTRFWGLWHPAWS